jgi:hypothetical protein
MIANLSKVALCALLASLLLAGCVDSAAPLMSGAQPLLGPEVRMQVFVLGDERATGPELGIFRWQDGEYRGVNQANLDIGAFTVYPLAGKNFLIQSRSSRPEAKAVSYGIARKLADAVYIIADIDDDDIDAATREKICTGDSKFVCRVVSRDNLLTLARASAAKPDLKGSLVVLVAEKP